MTGPGRGWPLRAQLGRLRYLPAFGLAYLNNPKAACTSVKRVLWRMQDRRDGRATFAGNAHDLAASPFRGLGALAADVAAGRAVALFSVVRNPHARLLSAWLDKVARVNPGHTRRVFVDRFGLAAEAAVGFRAFLRLLAFESPAAADEHFAPQAANLCWPALAPDRLFALEAAGPLWSWLGGLDGHDAAAEAAPDYRHRAADRAARREDPAAAEMVRALHGADFAAFGYGPDAARAADPPALPALPAPDPAARAALLQAYALMDAPAAERAAGAEAALAALVARGGADAAGDWAFYVAMRLHGPRTEADRARMVALCRADPADWRLAEDFLQCCGPGAAAEAIRAGRDAALARHRAVLRALPYAPPPG